MGVDQNIAGWIQIMILSLVNSSRQLKTSFCAVEIAIVNNMLPSVGDTIDDSRHANWVLYKEAELLPRNEIRNNYHLNSFNFIVNWSSTRKMTVA